MGADGGATLFDRAKLEKFLSKKKNRKKLSNLILDAGNHVKEYEVIYYVKIADAVDDLDKLISAVGYPWMQSGNLSIAGAKHPIVSISFGTNIWEPAGDICDFFEYEVPDAVIWSAETWT